NFAKIMAVIAIVILGYYFSVVPFRQTGLYAVFFASNYLDYALAREASAKTLSNALAKYLIVNYIYFFGPLLCIILYLQATFFAKRRNMLKAVTFILLLVLMLLTIGVSGARGPVAYAVLILFYFI